MTYETKITILHRAKYNLLVSKGLLLLTLVLPYELGVVIISITPTMANLLNKYPLVIICYELPEDQSLTY